MVSYKKGRTAYHLYTTKKSISNYVLIKKYALDHFFILSLCGLLIFQKKLFGTQISAKLAKGFNLICHNYILNQTSFLNNFCDGGHLLSLFSL